MWRKSIQGKPLRVIPRRIFPEKKKLTVRYLGRGFVDTELKKFDDKYMPRILGGTNDEVLPYQYLIARMTTLKSVTNFSESVSVVYIDAKLHEGELTYEENTLRSGFIENGGLIFSSAKVEEVSADNSNYFIETMAEEVLRNHVVTIGKFLQFQTNSSLRIRRQTVERELLEKEDAARLEYEEVSAKLEKVSDEINNVIKTAPTSKAGRARVLGSQHLRELREGQDKLIVMQDASFQRLQNKMTERNSVTPFHVDYPDWVTNVDVKVGRVAWQMVEDGRGEQLDITEMLRQVYKLKTDATRKIVEDTEACLIFLTKMCSMWKRNSNGRWPLVVNTDKLFFPRGEMMLGKNSFNARVKTEQLTSVGGHLEHTEATYLNKGVWYHDMHVHGLEGEPEGREEGPDMFRKAFCSGLSEVKLVVISGTIFLVDAFTDIAFMPIMNNFSEGMCKVTVSSFHPLVCTKEDLALAKSKGLEMDIRVIPKGTLLRDDLLKNTSINQEAKSLEKNERMDTYTGTFTVDADEEWGGMSLSFHTSDESTEEEVVPETKGAVLSNPLFQKLLGDDSQDEKDGVSSSESQEDAEKEAPPEVGKEETEETVQTVGLQDDIIKIVQNNMPRHNIVDHGVTETTVGSRVVAIPIVETLVELRIPDMSAGEEIVLVAEVGQSIFGKILEWIGTLSVSMYVKSYLYSYVYWSMRVGADSRSSLRGRYGVEV